MADITLYDEPVSYPVTEAVANGKLEFTKKDSVIIEIPTSIITMLASRGATTDPWEIQVTKTFAYKTRCTFSTGEVNCSGDSLGWKSMADLVLKAHNRPVQSANWPLINVDRPGLSFIAGPFYVADASQPYGYKAATLAEMKAAISIEMDESGDASLKWNGVLGGAVLMARGLVTAALTKAITTILADTTHTALSYDIAVVDAGADGKTFGAEIATAYRLVQATGTDAMSIGNYALGSRSLRIETQQIGVADGYHERKLRKGDVFGVPAIIMDSMRKASKSGGLARITVAAGSADEAITVDDLFSQYPVDGIGNMVLAHVCIADPNGYLEVDFDQSNSLNVLATAAFAGLGGLASVGAATELERLLGNSSLSPLFANAAVVLGSTTSAVITGYVASLIAAYTQGWITNTQLFNLSNHVAWIKGGLTTIVGASAAGVTITETASLLGYLGVGGNPLQMAMTAVGGAATSAGIALGMAAVMGKSVKHTYWGA